MSQYNMSLHDQTALATNVNCIHPTRQEHAKILTFYLL